MKKLRVMSLILLCSLILNLISCQSSDEDIEEMENFSIQQNFKAEPIKNKSSSFKLTEDEYKILVSGDLNIVKTSISNSSFKSSNSNVSSIGLEPTLPTEPEPVGPTTSAKVVICEQYGNNYHCYELLNTAKCPAIYASIENVTCTDF